MEEVFEPRNARIAGTRLSAVSREKAAIEEEVTQQEKSLAVLHQFLDELALKLDPVLSQALTDSASPMRDTFGSSRLCHTLYSHNNSISNAIERVSDLIRRAEV